MLVLAIVMFLIYRKDSAAFQLETKRQTELWQAQVIADRDTMRMMIEVIKENSEIVAKHTELVNAMAQMIRDSLSRQERRR
jgi:hypothetical protein